MTEVIEVQDQPSAGEVAWAIQTRIKDAMRDGRDALWRLAEALYEFEEAKGWLGLGYDNKEQWLADADITLSKGTYHRYVRTWRKLVVERQIPADRLRQLDQSKVAIVTNAISRNEVMADEALSDVEVLPASDLREKYYGPKPEPEPSNVGRGEEPEPESAYGHQDADPNAVMEAAAFPLVDPDSHEPMSEEELSAALAEEAARDPEATVLTTAVVDGQPVLAEVLPGYEYPPWMTKGSVEAMLNDVRFGLGSGASYPRLSRQGCQIAEQLAQAWLATQSS